MGDRNLQLDCNNGSIRTATSAQRQKAARLQDEFTRMTGWKGWVTGFMKHALIANRFAIPIGGAQRITVSASNLLRLKYENLISMIGAAENVLQGNAVKQVIAPVQAVAGVATVAALTTRSVGVAIRISDSVLNADYRQVPLNITGTGADNVEFTETPCHNFTDIIVFFVSNNAGEGTLVAPTNGTVTIPADRVRPGAFLCVESITLRDLQ